MSTFRVVVGTYIPEELDAEGNYSDDDDGVFVHRVMDLPFPPYLGLSLEDGDWGCGPLDEVTFHVDQNLFEVYSSDGQEARETESMEEAEQTLREQGWEHDDPVLRR